MTNKTIQKSNITAEQLPVTVNNRIIEIMLRKKDMERQHKFEEDKIHRELWAAIHEEYPGLDEKLNYSIDTSYLKGRIAILTRKDKSKDMGGMIARLLSDM